MLNSRKKTGWSAPVMALVLSLLGAGCTELVWIPEVHDGASDVLQADTYPDVDVPTPPDASDGGPADVRDASDTDVGPADAMDGSTPPDAPDADVDVPTPPDASDGGPADVRDASDTDVGPADAMDGSTPPDAPDADVDVPTPPDASDGGPADVRDASDTDVGPDAPICPGRTLCSARCVDTATDSTNCGRCGNACPSSQSCVAGVCACPTGRTACGTGPSTACVDLQNDRVNCGRCGGTCPSTVTCSGAVCIDAISVAPDMAQRFYIEQPSFAAGGGVDRSFSAFRSAPRSEYLDSIALSIESYYAPVSGRAYKIGRVALRFAPIGLPSGVRVTAARIEFRHNGRWADPARTIIVVVPFVPRGTELISDDFVTSQWGMTSSMGEAPNALWGDGASHPIMFTTGFARLAGPAAFWLGIVTGHDRDNVAPPDPGGLSGMAADAASIRLRVSYTFAP